MSDTVTAEMPPEVKEELENIALTTKRGFDVGARVKKRGLRRGTITIYLDEDKADELGWARDITDQFGNVLGRERQGVNGELDAVRASIVELETEYQKAVDSAKVLETPAAELKKAKAATESLVEATNGRIAELEEQRDALEAELTKTSLVISMRAVPPVIQKNCRRLAKQTLKIDGKTIPVEQQDDFDQAQTAHMMTVMFQSITDTESGAVNTEFTYDDGIALMEQLPPDQFTRLDVMMGKVQFTDSISRAIEGQEDFS